MEIYNWKIAIRYLIKQRRATFINISGLALGFTFVMLIFIYIIREFTYDSFHENADNIYKPEFFYSLPDVEANKTVCLSIREIDLIRESVPGIKAITFLNYSRWDWDNGAWIEYDGKKINLEKVAFSDKYLPEIFSFKAKQGNLAASLDDPKSLILTSEIAEKIFGTNNPIGKTVLLNNIPVVITSVLQPLPSNSSLNFSALVSYKSAQYFFKSSIDDFSNIPFILTRENVSLSSVEKSISSTILSSISSEFREEEIPEVKTKLLSIKDLYFHEATSYEPIKHGEKSLTIVLLAIGILIMLLAIINYINLSFAASGKWNRQEGIQLILGAGKNSGKKQLFIKGFLISLIAFAFSILIINISLPWFNTLVKYRLLSDDIFSLKFAIASVIVLFFVVILSGFFSSFFLQKSTVISQIKGEYKTFVGHGKIWKYLVVFQLFISISLICAALIITKQIHFALHKNIGLKTKNVITLPLSKLDNKKVAYINSIEKNPQTSSYCFSTSYINTQNVWGGRLKKPTEEPEEFIYFNIRSDEKFIPTLGFEIIQGRNFNKNPRGDLNAYIINETALKEYNISDPLHTTINGNPIVGVIKDFNYNSLHNKIEPVAICNTSDHISMASIHFAADSKADLKRYINFLKNEWESLDNSKPFEFEFLDQRLENLYTEDIKLMKTITSFSLLSIFIACLGLFGLLVYIMEAKTKEIGIRKVNGAKVIEILKLFYSDLLKLVAVAFLIATPITWYAMNKWLENFAYKTELSWWVFGVAGALAVAVAVLTVSWQSFRAATRNPVEALRYE